VHSFLGLLARIRTMHVLKGNDCLVPVLLGRCISGQAVFCVAEQDISEIIARYRLMCPRNYCACIVAQITSAVQFSEAFQT
jgi:hypothetical protein